jgi:hypothetical protein
VNVLLKGPDNFRPLISVTLDAALIVYFVPPGRFDNVGRRLTLVELIVVTIGITLPDGPTNWIEVFVIELGSGVTLKSTLGVSDRNTSVFPSAGVLLVTENTGNGGWTGNVGWTGNGGWTGAAVEPLPPPQLVSMNNGKIKATVF